MIIFLVFFLGLTTLLSIRYVQVDNAPPFAARQSSFAFTPPAQALTGRLSAIYGKVEVLTRENDEFTESPQGATLSQGESVATKKNSGAMLTLVNALTLEMEENAEINLINLITETLTIWQKSGTITYQPSSPISVRALHSLLVINPGSTTVTIDEKIIAVHVVQGSVKLALVDADNTTNVWTAEKGQRIIIDDEDRSIVLRR